MKRLNEKDKVIYDGKEYSITKVWFHGGDLLYYDLEATAGAVGYKKIQLSVHHTETTELRK